MRRSPRRRRIVQPGFGPVRLAPHPVLFLKREGVMKARFVTAIALSLALSQVAMSAAYAEPVHFRTAAAQTFSQTDLQAYGLSSADAAQVAQLQTQGYHVQVVTPDQARAMHGGDMSARTWWIIGGIIVVIAIVAAAND
jgi:hypothetical protein